MDDDNDFTFCQVGIPVDQESSIAQDALPDIGGVTIKDGLLKNPVNDQIESSSDKQKSLDNANFRNPEKIGSLSFTVTDKSTPKHSTQLPKQAEITNSKDPLKDSAEQMLSTKKPVVRTKVPFEKGYSQMDWLKLTRTHPDLAGLKGESNKRIISMDEVKKHRTGDSIWTVLKGRVYNISPYMNFHPGGVDMLMKGAGKDCTSLFNKYHAWVNYEFLLQKCLVGTLDERR